MIRLEIMGKFILKAFSVTKIMTFPSHSLSFSHAFCCRLLFTVHHPLLLVGGRAFREINSLSEGNEQDRKSDNISADNRLI